MDTPFNVRQVVQEDPVEGEFQVPVLDTPQVVIIYSPDSESFVDELFQQLKAADPTPYVTVGHNLNEEMSDEQLFEDVRRCLKVVVIFSMEMMDVAKQRKRMVRELRVVEDVISERHMECVVPIYYGINPGSEDIPDTAKYSSCLPAEHQKELIKAEDKNFDLILSKISEQTPIACSGSHGVAYGIAWSYFFGWLYIILQELRERIITTATENHTDWNIERTFELYPKLIVIIPRNGYNVATLSAYDPKVQHVLSKTRQTPDGFGEPIKAKYTRDMIGQPNRDYSTPLFKTSHKGKTYVFAAEVPSCLRTLKEMADPDSDYVPDFNVIDHHRELHVFMGQLNRILNIKTKTDKFAHLRRQTVRIIYFDDEHDSLSEVLVNTIEDDIKWQSSPNPWSTSSLKMALPAQ